MTAPRFTIFPPLRTAMVVMMACTALAAQPRMEIQSVDTSQFPGLAVRVAVERAGRPVLRLTRANFTLHEDAVQQDIISAWCPFDSVVRLSALLLLDRSSSMAMRNDSTADPDSLAIRSAKAAVSAFLGSFDTRDEAAICSFSSDEGAPFFTVDHGFSGDTASLRRALVPITARGGTRLWDALMEALRLVRMGRGQRHIIALTDGESAQDLFAGPDAVIATARQAGVPIHVVGLGGTVNADLLRTVAQATGGRFYVADSASALTGIYAIIARDVLTDACVLRYISTNPCHDTLRRSIELTCSGAGFTAEADTGYTPSPGLRQGSILIGGPRMATSGGELDLPIVITAGLATGVPLTCTLRLAGLAPHLTVLGASTAGTRCEAASVRIDSLSEDAVRITATGPPSSDPTPVFLILRLHIPSLMTDTTADLLLISEDFRQDCPIGLQPASARLALWHCFELFRPLPRHLHATAGTEVLVPIALQPHPMPGHALSGDISFLCDSSIARITGSLAPPGRPMDHAMLWNDGSHARITFASSTLEDSTLLVLRLQLQPRREAAVTALHIADGHLVTGCETAFARDSIMLWIDGLCDRIMQRKEAVSLAVSPNPAGAEITVRIWRPHGGSCAVFITDALGHRIACLLEEDAPAGTLVRTVLLPALPTGRYWLQVQSADGAASAPLSIMH